MDPTDRAIELAKLEIAREQYERDLARDPVVDELVQRLADPNINDTMVRHLATRITAHCTLRRLSSEDRRRRAEAAEAQIIHKVYDPVEREERKKRHRESKKRALEVLGRSQRDDLIFKVHDNAPTERAPMTKTTEHPLEVLAEEMGIVAARIERDAVQKLKTMKAELELHFERCIREQDKQIAELRGQLSVLLTRAERPEQPTDFDFNEARAASRN